MKEFIVGQKVRIVCQCDFYYFEAVGTVKEVSQDFKKIKVEFNNEGSILSYDFIWNINLWQSYIYSFEITEAK